MNNKADLTYIRLLYGPVEATEEFVNRLPPEVLEQYLLRTYMSSNNMTVDRVATSLRILPDVRLKRLEEILVEYHGNN